MGELAVKIGTHGAFDPFDDGDVLQAFNKRMIQWVHAQHVFWPRVNGRRVGGLQAVGYPLLEQSLALCSQYKWERVSESEVCRTNLRTGSVVTYGSKPVPDPDDPEQEIFLHVREHFRHKHDSGKTPLFGQMNREIEYGGSIASDSGTVGKVWDAIEAATDLKRTAFNRWPAGTNDLKEFLFVCVDDFDDDEARELESPLTEPAPITDDDGTGERVVRERKHGVDWRRYVLPSVSSLVSAADIENPKRTIDIRGHAQFGRRVIVGAKQLQVER